MSTEHDTHTDTDTDTDTAGNAGRAAPVAGGTLREPRVARALQRMFAEAERDDETWERVAERLPRDASLSPRERADAASEIYMPVSPEGGVLLYTLVRGARPRTVVEFGTSFGISTLHLAAGVRDNGFGRVVTTELSPAKVAAARSTFAETGLDDLITVLEGDALETLAALRDAGGLDGTGLVLLDGWKQLCLPVLRLLEPVLAPGALVLVDDVGLAALKPCLDYVRDPANGFESVTFPVGDGMELACRL